MENNLLNRSLGSCHGRSIKFHFLLITVGLVFIRSFVQAQQPAADYDALIKALRNATSSAQPVAQVSKKDQALYDQTVATAQQAIAAGNYAKGIEWATLVLQAWPGDPTGAALLAQAQQGAPTPVVPAAAPEQPASAPPTSDLSATIEPSLRPPGSDSSESAPMPKPPKATKHEVSASVDYLLGSGTVTLPVGYSLANTLPGTPVPVGAKEADRTSTYYGATISYSYGQAWYFDLSYASGDSSGVQDIDVLSLGKLPSDFTITDTWNQAYVRYTFPSLRGKRFSAYLRAGVTFVQADLKIDSQLPNGGRYTQTDATEDQLGNVGFGMGYWLYKSPRLRLALQLEGEAFYGTRTQDTLETLSLTQPGTAFLPATIDNTLSGGIGRATLRMELPLGRSGLFKVYMDGGLAGRITMIDYPDSSISASATSELLWGPYVKLGIRYAF